MSDNAVTTLEVASEYLRLGWAPIPIPHRTKAPRLPAWQKLRLTAAELPGYFDGQPLNVGVLLGVPSGGLVDVDLDCAEVRAIAPAILPPTGRTFGRKSAPESHWLYTANPPVPATTKYEDPMLDGTKEGHATLVELRSTGAQTVFPGSTHPSGESIVWHQASDADRVGAEELQAKVSTIAALALLARYWPAEGKRHAAALAVAGALLRTGLPEETVKTYMEQIVRAAGDPELGDRVAAVSTTAQRLEAGDTATGWTRLADYFSERLFAKVREWLGVKSASQQERGGREGYRLTDYGNAERLVARHGASLRYCATWGKWLIYDAGRWIPDDTGEVQRRAKSTVRNVYKEAAQAADSAVRQSIADHARKSESESRIGAMIALAQSETGIPVTAAQLDADPWLLNCRNGTVDLRTGALRQHNCEEMLTKLAGATYDPAAECPVWDRFLHRIFAGDAALIAYVQRFHGYALTGDVGQQYLHVYHGVGANGKSTLLDTILHVMGDYADLAPPDLLLVKRSDEHPTEQADLLGKRLVIASESEKARRLRVQLMKRLTGDAKLKARFMRQDYFTFDRTFKLVLVTNNRPRVDEDSEATWRRIRLVPFQVVIPPEERDLDLLYKLKDEAPGILRWMVEGCLRWHAEGLGAPEAVEAATTEYREESDPFADFLRDCCIVAPNAWAASKMLREEYERWCSERGEPSLSGRDFAEALRKHHCEPDPHHGSRGWAGIGLLTTAQPATP